MRMIKLLLLRCTYLALSLLASDTARPVWAQTENLQTCKGHDYIDRVRELRIDISPSVGIPERFGVEVEHANARIIGATIPNVEVRKAAESAAWEGRSSQRFKFKEVDLRPRIPGFSVSGPESCEYQVEVENDRKECVAWYRFRARHVKLAFETDPPAASLRILRDSATVGNPDRQCVPVTSEKPDPGEEKLAAEIRTELAKEKVLDPFAIEVSTRTGSVFIAGLVDSEIAKRRATEAVERIVKKTRRIVNNLQLGLVGGTSLIDADKGTLTVAIDIEGEPTFFAPLDVPWDLVLDKGWPVTPADLLAANARWIAANSAAKHGRRVPLLKIDQAKLAKRLAGIKSITIKRIKW